jgi:hypothetical protein
MHSHRYDRQRRTNQRFLGARHGALSHVEDVPLSASFEVTGRITASDALDLMAVHQRGADLTFRLADGRLVDASMVDGWGPSSPRVVGFTASKASGQTSTSLGMG